MSLGIPDERTKYRVTIGVGCLILVTIIFQLYRGGQYYWWSKPEHPETAIDLRHKLTLFT